MKARMAAKYYEDRSGTPFGREGEMLGILPSGNHRPYRTLYPNGPLTSALQYERPPTFTGKGWHYDSEIFLRLRVVKGLRKIVYMLLVGTFQFIGDVYHHARPSAELGADLQAIICSTVFDVLPHLRPTTFSANVRSTVCKSFLLAYLLVLTSRNVPLCPGGVIFRSII